MDVSSSSQIILSCVNNEHASLTVCYVQRFLPAGPRQALHVRKPVWSSWEEMCVRHYRKINSSWMIQDPSTFHRGRVHPVGDLFCHLKSWLHVILFITWLRWMQNTEIIYMSSQLKQTVHRFYSFSLQNVLVAFCLHYHVGNSMWL